MEARILSKDEYAERQAVRDANKVGQLAHMAGIGKGVALDPKPFFHMQTALTTSPGAMHFALAGRPDDNAKR